MVADEFDVLLKRLSDGSITEDEFFQSLNRSGASSAS